MSESEDGEAKTAQVLDEEVGVVGENLESPKSDSVADRKVFLASFTSEEDKAIRRKVDWRFLWLIGLMYIIKNVSLLRFFQWVLLKRKLYEGARISGLNIWLSSFLF